jgi:hypothetical protein
VRARQLTRPPNCLVTRRVSDDGAHILQKATTMRVKKMSGYAYGKINRYLVGASLQFSS